MDIRGRKEIWVAAIVYVIVCLNFLFLLLKVKPTGI